MLKYKGNTSRLTAKALAVNFFAKFNYYSCEVLPKKEVLMKTTEKVLNEIKETDDVSKYINENKSELNVKQPSFVLDDLLKSKNTTRANVLRKCGMNKAYMYQIFSGERFPSRDKAIVVGFGFELKLDEMQSYLKQIGYKELYAKSERDAVIIFCLNRGFGLIDVNLELHKNKYEILE